MGEVSYGFAHFASLKNVRPDQESRAGGLGDTEFGAVVVTFGL